MAVCNEFTMNKSPARERASYGAECEREGTLDMDCAKMVRITTYYYSSLYYKGTTEATEEDGKYFTYIDHVVCLIKNNS